MELINIANQIKAKEKLLSQMRSQLKIRGDEKADSIRDYYKKKTILIFQLNNGIEIEFEGMKIIKPNATLVKEIIKGLCYEELHKKELAVARYQTLIANIDAVKAELNSLQSLNRHLD